MLAKKQINTILSYSYRDASNYKLHAEVIVSGILTIEDIKHYLHEESFFIPYEVELEELQPNPMTNAYDHIWHEIDSITPTDMPPNCPLSASKLKELFANAFANHWNEHDAFIRKGLI